MATANGGDGVLRPRARESEGETGESEREQGERRGVVQGVERGGERQRRRRCRASGDPWSGGEEEGVEAELLSLSGERGVVGDGG